MDSEIETPVQGSCVRAMAAREWKRKLPGEVRSADVQQIKMQTDSHDKAVYENGKLLSFSRMVAEEGGCEYPSN